MILSDCCLTLRFLNSLLPSASYPMWSRLTDFLYFLHMFISHKNPHHTQTASLFGSILFSVKHFVSRFYFALFHKQIKKTPVRYRRKM